MWCRTSSANFFPMIHPMRMSTVSRNILLLARHSTVNRLSQLQKCLYTSQRSPAEDKKGFIGNFLDNIKQEMAKNKEMKESIKKFREEAQKLEESEALKQARKKFESIESEGSQQFKEQLHKIKDEFSKKLEEAQKSEFGKMTKEMTEELGKTAKSAAEALSKQREQLEGNTAFKAVSEGVKAIKDEVDDATMNGSTIYRPPKKLRKRLERSHHTAAEERVYEPNTEATGVELHKDSKWFQSWQNFKDNNPYVNKLFDWKTKFDESDNAIVRASRALTDKVADVFGGLFQKTELSEVLTEICKIDPDFDKNQFLKDCELDIIPNILEAMIRGDLEILKDWCHEAVFTSLSTPVIQAQKLGYRFDSKILDISSVDLAMAKIMEQGPVLVISFNTQQIMAMRDQAGKVIEGDPDKIVKVYYVWVLCRDQNEMDPKAAWKLIDLSAKSAAHWL